MKSSVLTASGPAALPPDGAGETSPGRQSAALSPYDLPAHPLAELFPMLPEQEIAELADDIVTFGQRMPIVLLDGQVLDGRNRLAACRFAEVEPRLEDYAGDDPLGFVLSHNLHRRHLTTSQRAMVAARIVDWEVGLNQHTAQHEGGSANLQTHVPAREAARRLSISERAVAAAKRIHEQGAAELVDAIRDGRLTVHAGEALSDLEHAAQQEVLRQEEREIVARAKAIRAERQRARHTVRLAHMEMVTEKGRATAPGSLARAYPVYYLDPPWKFGVRSEETGREKSAENHYPTMTTDEIVALLSTLIGDQAFGPMPGVMFLWATNPMLPDALRVMSVCGFTYVHHWIWDKEEAGTGYWGRDRHELLLIGRRGDVAAPLPGSQPETVHREKKGPHSAKPDFYAETIERLYPGIARLELFARHARPGWDVWGFETGLPIEPVAQSPVSNAGEVSETPGPPPGDGKNAKAGSLPEAAGTRQEAGLSQSPKLPPAPGPTAPVEFSVGGMKKGSSARFSIHLNDDGTFSISASYQMKGFCGAASPATGSIAGYAAALRLALGEMEKRLATIVDDTSSQCLDHHRAAARAGIRWIEARRAEWGLDDAGPSPSGPCPATSPQGGEEPKRKRAAKAGKAVPA